MSAWRLAPSVIVAGCSATQSVSNSANEIRGEARLLAKHGSETGDQVVVDKAERIYRLAADIHDQLPGLEDKVPAWMEMLMWGAVAVISVAVVVFLWQTGLGSAIRIGIGWLPRRKVSQAELALDTLDESRPESDRELVAALRSQDPVFDAAFRKAQQRRKKDA